MIRNYPCACRWCVGTTAVTYRNGSTVSTAAYANCITLGVAPAPAPEPLRYFRDALPVSHLLAEQAERERADQAKARSGALRALRLVSGRRVAEQRAALSVRASALRRAA